MTITPTAPADVHQQPALQQACSLRHAEWRDLGPVSRLLVTEFYGGNSIWYPAQCLSELNRLQMNFHFDRERHLMLVATEPAQGGIVGFVDIDARDVPPAKRNEYPPRPYLSDLAVAKNQRRKGIGTQLVQATNAGGLALYEAMGYLQARPIDEKLNGARAGT
ncbi:hypothetical protein JKP88DRAFT_276892 [Tribonema minus]|uniref:N-acetyltransferase domain-containing protein n=1 Tax=Tribonema minus TaxID=303371 RepID=A0A835Z109_9STRA|nr:hypothetical protein JKP88DRAFT_276892 [Tribonema minus]